jgi:Mrp family chromosome partitioning ATPase
VVLSEIGSVFATLVDQRLGSGAEGTTPGQEPLVPITASVFDPAHLEPGAISPRPKRTVVIAGVLGLVIGLVLAFARDALDDRIRGRRDAEDWFGAPVIGELPKDLGRRPYGLRGASPPRDPAVVDALYRLRANLQFSQGGISGPVLVVTSAVTDDSHSIVAANVAVTLALAGLDVICVEADMRRPQLERALDVSAGPLGLVDVLGGRCRRRHRARGRATRIARGGTERVPAARRGRGRRKGSAETSDSAGVERAVHGSLRVLPVGRVPPNPADVFTRDRTADLLDRLRKRAQYVVIDTPPLLTFGDAFPVLSLADNVVVVARDGQATRGIADSVRSTLSGLGVRKFSIVLTHSSVAGHGVSYHESKDVPPAGDPVPGHGERGARQTV